MKYLWLMTAAGSILFVCYLIWSLILGSFISRRMRYKALILVVLVYAVPWVWLKGVYSHAARWLLQIRHSAVSGVPVTIADIATKEEAYRTLDYRLQLWIAGVWFVVALGLVLYKSTVYIRNKRKLLKVSDKCTDSALLETEARLRRELRYEGRLEIYITPFNNTSFTLGAVRPVIFIQREYEEGQLYYILKHEMMHVVRRDLALKLLLEFVCCLHWFNPLVYILSMMFDDACERSCDEHVAGSCGYEGRRLYSQAVADNYGEGQRQKRRLLEKNIPFANRLTGTRRTMERVNLIMGAKEVKRWKKRVAASVFAVLMVVNSFTAMAYPDVHHVENADVEVAQDTVEGGAFWTGDFIGNGYSESQMPQFEVVYEDEFIDMEGNAYPVSPYTTYVFCLKHDIESGYYQTHRRNDSGGCTVKTYESTRCTVCNTIWIGDLFSTTTYVKCPHGNMP